MWVDVIPATNWALIWLCVVIFFSAKPGGPFSSIAYASRLVKVRIPAWLVLLLLALFIRLIPMLLLPVGAGYDIDSFRLVARALLNGEEVYTSAAQGRHPYLPFQMYLIGGALWATEWLPLPFVVLVKLPAVAADVLITGIIYRASCALGRTHEHAVTWALLYALNPISILVSAYHGQFDAVSVLLLLTAWYLWRFGHRAVSSALALGFAVLNKTWPIILLPIILLRIRRYRSRALFLTITLLIPTLFTVGYILFFSSDPLPMLSRALTHTGNAGYWGVTALLAVADKYIGNLERYFDYIVEIRRWLILTAGLVTLWHTCQQSVLDAVTTVILSIFVVTAGIGIQWLLWVIPFAMLAGDIRWLKWYSITGTLFLLIQLYGVHMYPWLHEFFEPDTADTIFRLGSIPAWIVVVLWTWSRIRRVEELSTASAS